MVFSDEIIHPLCIPNFPEITWMVRIEPPLQCDLIFFVFWPHIRGEKFMAYCAISILYLVITSVSTPGVVARLRLLSITISLSSESMNISVDDEVADIWLPEAVV